MIPIVICLVVPLVLTHTTTIAKGFVSTLKKRIYFFFQKTNSFFNYGIICFPLVYYNIVR